MVMLVWELSSNHDLADFSIYSIRFMPQALYNQPHLLYKTVSFGNTNQFSFDFIKYPLTDSIY